MKVPNAVCLVGTSELDYSFHFFLLVADHSVGSLAVLPVTAKSLFSNPPTGPLRIYTPVTEEQLTDMEVMRCLAKVADDAKNVAAEYCC